MARKKSLIIEILGNNKVTRAVRDAMSDLRRLGKFAGRIGGLIRKAFKFALVGVTAFTAGLTIALKESAKFNLQMARAWTMTGGGTRTFKAMREEVMLLSSELGVAKDQLAGGYYEALSKGVPRDNAIGFLRAVSKAAIVDLGDVQTMAKATLNVINAFGMEAKNAETIAGQLFLAVRKGGLNFTELADNVSKAASVFAASDVPLNEFLAAIATTTKAGHTAETALVALRNAALEVGKELGDTWSETRTFQEALEEIGASAKYSQTELTKIFGKRNVAVVLSMMGKNAAQAAKDLDSMVNPLAALTEAYQKMQQFRFWERLKASVMVAATRFGIAVEEGTKLSEVINQIADGADKLGKDFAEGILPYVESIREAVDNMLSGDPAKIQEGRDSIKAMFDQAGDYIQPKFEQWGFAAGEAIWRGFKSGGSRGLGSLANTKWVQMHKKSPGLAIMSAISAGYGGVKGVGPNAPSYEKFGYGLGLGAIDLKRTYLGPGSSKQNPQYVQEVKPISGVETP